MADPFLSIIVPTYNRGDMLVQTLDSLLKQDTNNYEILVVDDGSTDHTEALVQELIKNNNQNKLRYHKITNRERGAARNFGTSVARGVYVSFFDSDDIAYRNHVSLFTTTLSQHDSPSVFALSYDIKSPTGRTLKKVKLHTSVSDFIHEGNHLSCNGVFIKRDIARKHPFSEKRQLSGSEDYELWLRLAARFDFPCFPYVSHAVIQHENRSTMNFDPTTLVCRKILMLDTALDDPEVRKAFGSKTKILKASAFSYISLHVALTERHKKESLKWLVKSIRLNPSSIFSRRSLSIVKHLLLP